MAQTIFTSKYGRHVRPTEKMAALLKNNTVHGLRTEKMRREELELSYHILDLELKQETIEKEIIMTQLKLSQCEDTQLKQRHVRIADTASRIADDRFSPIIDDCNSSVLHQEEPLPSVEEIRQQIHADNERVDNRKISGIQAEQIEHAKYTSTPYTPRILKPEVSGYQPEVHGRQPEVSGYQPEVHRRQPEVSGYQPEVHGRQPEVSGHQPEARGQREVHGYQPQVHGYEREANRYEQESSSTAEPEYLVKLVELLTNHQQRPPMEPDIFNGDLLQFPIWLKSYEALIERTTPSATDRLYFLYKYTGGEARKVIHGFMSLEGKEAYLKAKRALVSRYGDKYKTSEAFKQALYNWPQVKDGAGLQKFSDFLQQCSASMDSISYLKSLDSADENRKLLKKLPDHVTNRWKRVIDRWLYGTEAQRDVCGDSFEGRYPTFSAFCKFIADEARIACGPGALSEITQSTHRKPRNATTFAVSTDETKKSDPQKKPYCNICKNEHFAVDCNILRKMDVTERKELAKKKGMCFRCLRKGHLGKDCRYRGPMLLFKNLPENSTKAEIVEVASHKIEVKTDERYHSLIVPVTLYHEDDINRQVKTYALLDNQSNACFVTKALAQQLKAPQKTVHLRLTTMSDKRTIPSELLRGLVVRGVQEEAEIKLPGTYTREIIPAEKDLIPRQETVSKWPHLKKIAQHLIPLEKQEIGLLIGFNCSAALLPREIVANGDHDPYAIKTSLGWGVTGPIGKTSDTSPHEHHFSFRTHVQELSPMQVQTMIEIDFQERKSDDKLSLEDLQFLEKTKDIHQRSDGHFELPLPFKGNVNLPDDKCLALKRLYGLRTKLKRNKQLHDDYIDFMENLIQKGYAERIPDEKPINGKVWYIPHHGVYHPKKPNKIRVVFDCSAEYQGELLNRHLLRGPDLINNLVGVLCRFRHEDIALSCDIEGMFHQVGVIPQHRDFLRFLWFDGSDIDSAPVTYRMTVHLFGATSSPGCANLALKKTADMFEDECGKEAADFVRKNFYVDDGLKSVSTVQEAKELINNTRTLCQRGGFNLHKFTCSERQVLEEIPVNQQDKSLQELCLAHDDLPTARTLGVQWCIETDEFKFQTDLKPSATTRRGILSTISSIFDPLGLVSPFVLTGRQLLQEICADKCDWDNPLPEKVESRWNQWCQEVELLQELRIPRSYKPKGFKETHVELHHFSDGSLQGYGQCSYLRLMDEKGTVHTSLVMAKSRVTPTRPVTIPRIELTAAVVSVKVAAFLDKELEYKNIKHVFWSDSNVVLGYIGNESKRFHIFVANRIQTIREHSTPDQWHYVNTKENPADLASRGMSASQMLNSSMWWEGPPFLRSHAVPENKVEAIISDTDPEVNKKATVYATEVKDTYVGILTRLEYFSDWHKARRAIALCLRYKEKLKKATSQEIKDEKKSKMKPEPIRTDELEHAEIEIIKAVQKEAFSEELEILRKGNSQDEGRESCKSSKTLSKLDPFMCKNGLLRVGGRIRRANVSHNLAHPKILPRKSHVTQMIIQHFHERTCHAGANTTLNEIRASGYWITRAKSTVASYIHRCITCRKLRGKSAGQKMADLPPDRLEPAPPFTYSGVDFFGPFYIKEGRSEKKRWGSLFTCLVTRAIHIEVAHGLTTDCFLNAYRRFIGRRGPIRLLRCDRGTNFVGAKNELAVAMAELDNDRIQRDLLKEKCDWIEFKFNFPHSSHMGGVWERMIRTARAVLSCLLDQHGHQLDDDLLNTLMVEVECVVNSRPLTNVDSDPMEPLTPSQLLTLKSKVVYPPPGIFVKEDLYCRKRWRRVQYLANQFWRRWLKEVLPTMQERRKWVKTQENLQVGDVVMSTEADVPRSQWPLGLILEVYSSEDDLVRKVRVKIADSTYERPIHKLIFLYRPSN